MNLSKFLNAVDSLSQSMEKKQLIAFVHDIARVHGKQLLMLEYKQNYSRRSAFHKELRTCGMKDGRK